MIINRVWAMPNKWTFRILPIAELINRYVGDGKGWIDPFSGQSTIAEFSNDLNPNTPASSHLDALEFIKSLQGNFNGCLLDPPYSPRQVKECYDSIGRHMEWDDAMLGYKRGLYKDAINPLIKPGGIVISFGWNSVGMGKKLGYEIIEILLVCHGSDHNDTIVTVEQKLQITLGDTRS